MISQADLKNRLAQIEDRCAGAFQPYGSGLHGIAHLREVALLAGQIAYEMGEDVEAAMVAGFLHDSARKDDDGGNQHALDSATLARTVLKDRFQHLHAGRICSAIAAHADGLTTDDAIAGALWDADRLTLTRLGRPLRLDMFSTVSGKSLAKARISARE